MENHSLIIQLLPRSIDKALQLNRNAAEMLTNYTTITLKFMWHFIETSHEKCLHREFGHFVHCHCLHTMVHNFALCGLYFLQILPCTSVKHAKQV